LSRPCPRSSLVASWLGGRRSDVSVFCLGRRQRGEQRTALACGPSGSNLSKRGTTSDLAVSQKYRPRRRTGFSACGLYARSTSWRWRRFRSPQRSLEVRRPTKSGHLGVSRESPKPQREVRLLGFPARLSTAKIALTVAVFGVSGRLSAIPEDPSRPADDCPTAPRLPDTP
jgi:hypothetical protein